MISPPSLLERLRSRMYWRGGRSTQRSTSNVTAGTPCSTAPVIPVTINRNFSARSVSISESSEETAGGVPTESVVSLSGFGREGSVPRRLGLLAPLVCETRRRFFFPQRDCGCYFSQVEAKFSLGTIIEFDDRIKRYLFQLLCSPVLLQLSWQRYEV